MIETAGMNCDEITDLIYDIRDGKVKNEDVNWSFNKPKEESNNTINKECELCRRYGIEKGDSLYQVGYPDTGIAFYEIRNIQFCPLCGKALKEDNT